jgi:putative membrane protein
MFGGRNDDTAATGAGGPAPAKTGAVAEQPSLSAQDREFMMRASQGGMAEVEASRLAVTRASSPEVRAFAQQMVRDHTATNDELMRIARSKNVMVNPQLDAQERSRMATLEALSGTQFERVYVEEMGVKAHQDAIAVYESEARGGTDPDLRAFASRTLLALREHLAMAEQAAAVAAKE